MVEKINRLIGFYKRLCVGLLTGFCLAAVFAHNSFAESAPIIISDDETELLLRRITEPLFKVAGITFNPNKIYIVSDPSLNAFVSDGNYLFIHTGTLMNADNVNQLSGIIAHESGHIAGGHIVRQKLQISKLQTLSVASLIAAGAAAAASGRGDAALAVMLGSQSSLLNSLTSYQVQEERSADESAVQYLNKLGQSSAGLSEFIKKIRDNNRLNGYEEIPYFRTHPMSIERLNFFNENAKTGNGKTSSPLDPAFEMVKAKLTAFLLPVERVWKLYPAADQSDKAEYAHAILYYRQNKLDSALAALDKLIAKQPQNPYFYELKGQFLFESGKIAAAQKAFTQARNLAPNSPDILLAWAQASLEGTHDKNDLKEIIAALNQSLLRRNNLTGWLLLARAYDESDRPVDALYASARYSMGLGNYDAATRQIKQAEQHHPSASMQLKLNDLKNALGRQQSF